ncbi:hypothetical protein FACS189427_02610 [Planctomycetales bacterium]|nr:hypothetical protein FACS189427_02610 [Planctomycetales bacterium]
MKVYITGEDPVTLAVIKRILFFCSKEFKIIGELPARGGQIKSKIREFNKLSLTYPVVLLTDLDTASCAPELLNKLLPETKNEHFLFNIAVDEAEAWLMADRKGFAEYFAIPFDKMPDFCKTKQGGIKECLEINLRYKSSLHFTTKLMEFCTKIQYKQQLTPPKGASKGREYNTCVLPFIEGKWNISNAQKNSDSLDRMIKRLNALIAKK